VNIIKTYEAGVQNREYYLSKADAVARLTIPEVNPRGVYGNTSTASSASQQGQPAIHTCGQPWSTAGTAAVTTLGSTILSLLFPVTQPWLTLKPSITPLKQAEEQSASWTEVMGTFERRINESMLRHQYHATMLQTLYEVIIAGNAVVHKLPGDDGLRLIPLRNFIVKRYNGQPAYLCICEELPTPENPDKCAKLYTFVDYRKGEVWQQQDNQIEAAKVDVKASHYIVVTTSVPSMADYATGFALRYYGAMYLINQLASDMARAVQIAAQAVMVISEDSGWNPADIQNAKPGQILVGNKDALGWVMAGEKLNEWTWVYQAIEVAKRELAQAFALGLSQQPELNKDRQTAASVERLAAELDAAAGAIAQVLQTTLQRPLAQAYLEDELANDKDAEALVKAIRPVVTSGYSALSRLNELQKLYELLGQFVQYDPTITQRLDTMRLFLHGASILGLPVQEFIRQAPEEQGQIGQIGPQGPAQVQGQPQPRPQYRAA
jgi:hypothetical protein